jgi:hypothetical protein
MNEQAIIEHIRRRLEGVDIITATEGSGAPEVAWGDTFFIYDPDHVLAGAQQFPFATIVTKDYGDFDRASNLNREGAFRLNIGVSRPAYESMFGPVSSEHLAGGGRDFSEFDRLLPHPVYARQRWVCILNPRPEQFERVVWPLLVDAHGTAVARYRRRGGR